MVALDVVRTTTSMADTNDKFNIITLAFSVMYHIVNSCNYILKGYLRTEILTLSIIHVMVCLIYVRIESKFKYFVSKSAFAMCCYPLQYMQWRHECVVTSQIISTSSLCWPIDKDDIKATPKLRTTNLCEVSGGFSQQRANNAESISMSCDIKKLSRLIKIRCIKFVGFVSFGPK